MRFLHTADWQLGMPAHFLGEEARTRYSAARLAAVRRIGDVARDQGCAFVVVCGDVFDANRLAPATVARALEAMRAIQVPVYLLPGNHDPLDASSIYRSPEFTDKKPDLVHVLETAGVHEVAPGVELVAAPWTSKRPLEDLIAAQIAGLEPATDGTVRIVVGHGALESLSPDVGQPALIRSAPLREALADGRIHYVALGDRHSRTDGGIGGRPGLGDGRVWYSGSQEVTDFDEEQPGYCLVVDLDDTGCTVADHKIGTWTFMAPEVNLNAAEDVDGFKMALDGIANKEDTVLKLRLSGTLSLHDKARLDAVLENAGHLFAGINVWERHRDLAVLPDDGDFSALGLSGYAAKTAAQLRALAAPSPGGDAEDARTAQDALGLLYRLAGGAR